MADARSLLRAQRAARRIEHPLAAYTDSGKLLCTACREHVRAESLWDAHVRGAAHRRRFQQAQQQKQQQESNYGYCQMSQSHKRKLAEDSDVYMGGGGDDWDEDGDVGARSAKKKRTESTTEMVANAAEREERDLQEQNHGRPEPPAIPCTPPLDRRQSGTPSVGVEVQIPSRPATPATSASAKDNSSSRNETPRAACSTAEPLVPEDAITATGMRVFASTASAQPTASIPLQSAVMPSAFVPIDEDEWAAFEAELVKPGEELVTNGFSPTAAAFGFADGVISASAMTAAEVAAKSAEEEAERKRAVADKLVASEKEEATRALEDEFEEMEQLEARVSRLKKKREALRIQSGGGGGASGNNPGVSQAPLLGERLASCSLMAAGQIMGGLESGKKKLQSEGIEESDEEDEEDEEGDEDEDNWVSFRFQN